MDTSKSYQTLGTFLILGLLGGITMGAYLQNLGVGIITGISIGVIIYDLLNTFKKQKGQNL